MSFKENSKIYYGLDIGTDSVGWSTTNEKYELLRYKNNLMWGVSLFEAASLAEDRRGHRTQRRRYDRRQQRVALLGELSDNVINSALNYGYSIILSAFNREITSNGYITQLGLFHDNMFNNFNLASDLMEPFRTLIDRFVREKNYRIFTSEQKREIIGILNESVIINNTEQYVTNAVKIYCRSVFDAIEENDVSLIRFYRVRNLKTEIK